MEVLRKIVIFFFCVVTVINYDYKHNGRKTDLFLLYRDTEEALLAKRLGTQLPWPRPAGD